MLDPVPNRDAYDADHVANEDCSSSLSESFEHIHERLAICRQRSLALTASLSAEDQVAQACPEASPTKWHLAHTTWFFESFILRPFLDNYQVYSDDFEYCFNSYYESIGKRIDRGCRGLLTRPTLAEVHRYRAHINSSLLRLADKTYDNSSIATLLELGIAHEQQHQELMLTDILALFAAQPLQPAYETFRAPAAVNANTFAASDEFGVEGCAKCTWIEFPGGITQTGHDPADGFAFDNEGPVHRALLQPYRIASNLITNGEWIEFINDDGYRNPRIWLSDGWSWVNKERISAPGYWQWTSDGWRQMTLFGFLPVREDSPVCNVSFYEADAFAKWAGKRLPTEFEWEHAARESGWTVTEYQPFARKLTPTPVERTQRCKLKQAFGDVWQWTSSPYVAYPGFAASPNAVGEYNGKFMCSQMVLRGSSFATPPGHTRVTYRNFFYPQQRWQFTGLRLAEDLQ